MCCILCVQWPPEVAEKWPKMVPLGKTGGQVESSANREKSTVFCLEIIDTQVHQSSETGLSHELDVHFHLHTINHFLLWSLCIHNTACESPWHFIFSARSGTVQPRNSNLELAACCGTPLLWLPARGASTVWAEPRGAIFRSRQFNLCIRPDFPWPSGRKVECMFFCSTDLW